MSDKIYPCLWFDGKAGEAAAFYCSLFPGARITTNTPLVVLFEIHGKKIMGLNGGPMFQINPSISFFVLCSNSGEARGLWDQLVTEGKVLMPIGKYPWSECYGWVQDRFGMTWQVSVVNQPGDPPAITPSFLFTAERFGKAEEAIRFYSQVFKDGAIKVLFHYPEGDPHAGKVMYAEFNLQEYPLIAMDGPGEHAYRFNEGLSLVVDCADQAEVDHYWEALQAGGGSESMCGWLKDRFGVSWQIVPRQLGELMGSQDREKAQRAMQALMQMKKIIIADLQKAFDGN